MKDKNQYTQNGDTSGAVAAPKSTATPRTPGDIKLSQLEDLVVAQNSEIAKLRRDINRLKSEVSDIIGALKNGR